MDHQLVLDKNLTPDQIKAAIEASGIIDASVAGWDSYFGFGVAGAYEITYSVLPDALTEDIDCTVTFVPQNIPTAKAGQKLLKRPVPFSCDIPLVMFHSIKGTAFRMPVRQCHIELLCPGAVTERKIFAPPLNNGQFTVDHAQAFRSKSCSDIITSRVSKNDKG